MYTIKAISHALNLAFKDYNVEPFSDEETMAMVGKSSRYLIHKAINRRLSSPMTSEKEEKLLNRYNRLYLENASYETKVYPGIIDMLNEIKVNGNMLAVFSNKPDDIALKVLGEFFEKNTFDKIRGYREDTKRKPDPEGLYKMIEELGLNKGDIIYIGDSEVDAELAIKADVDAILVSYGYCKKEHLKEFNFDIADSCDGILKLLRKRGVLV